jgi:beta-glucosidase
MAIDGDTVMITVRNTGSRPGREVVQLYASRPDSAVQRAPLWLIGAAIVEVAPGEAAQASVTTADHNFRHWDSSAHIWVTEPGQYQLHAGCCVAELPLTGEIWRG